MAGGRPATVGRHGGGGDGLGAGPNGSGGGGLGEAGRDSLGSGGDFNGTLPAVPANDGAECAASAVLSADSAEYDRRWGGAGVRRSFQLPVFNGDSERKRKARRVMVRTR